MKLYELHAHRAAAGQAYAAAAVAYLDAYAELHACDLALGASLQTGGFPELRAPTPHGTYLPDSLHGDVQDRVMARVAQIQRN